MSFYSPVPWCSYTGEQTAVGALAGTQTLWGTAPRHFIVDDVVLCPLVSHHSCPLGLELSLREKPPSEAQNPTEEEPLTCLSNNPICATAPEEAVIVFRQFH